MYIYKVRCKNFKSFKSLNVVLSPTFVALAGPNGSGKSNICDAINFALGEMSTKALRIRAIKDIIHIGCKWCSVSIVLKHKGEEYEITRKIRIDGKTEYRLNGKRTSRSEIQEFLRKHGIDGSGRNIIVQGRVKKIIEMSGKERRVIIDSIAGISEFENKKKEAIKELDAINDRIKETNIILGEKMTFLRELESEKEKAERYMKAKEDYKKAKKRVLEIEKSSLEAELDKNNKELDALEDEMKEIEDRRKEIENRSKKIEKERERISVTLRSSSGKSSLPKRIEEMKTKYEVNKAKISELEKEISEAEARITTKRMQADRLKLETNSLIRELERSQKRVKDLRTKLPQKISSKNIEKEIATLRNEISTIGASIGEKREKISGLKAQIEEKETRLQELRKDAESTEESRNKLKKIKEEISNLNKKLRESFNKASETSERIDEIDKKILKTKEEISTLKLRAKPSRGNPAIEYVNMLLSRGIYKGGSKGKIYGFVSDLISFSSEYSDAVESAGGGRLRYVVVDSIDTAIRIIDDMKKKVKGRLSFIPVKDIRVEKLIRSHKSDEHKESAKNVPGVPLISLVEYDDEIENAVRYVFGDTRLVNNVSDAKKVIKHGYRAVMLTGELFESSGVVSGGSRISTVLLENKLKSLEDDLRHLMEEKKMLAQELADARNDGASIRDAKSKLEVEYKTIEIELGNLAKIDTSLKRLEGEVSKLKSELSSEINEIEVLNKEFNGKQIVLNEKERNLKRLLEEENKEYVHMSNEIASLETKIDGIKREMEIKKDRLKELEEEELGIKRGLEDKKKQIVLLKEENERLDKEIRKMEERLANVNKEIDDAIKKLNEYEDMFRKIGEEISRIKASAERINKQIMDIKLKNAAIETKLKDVLVEFGALKEVDSINVGKDDAIIIMEEAEKIVSEMSDVNLGSIKMYEEKKNEINRIQEKIKRIAKERRAVIGMIRELEKRKREAFFETFNEVDRKFQEMFKYLPGWKGKLYLENNEDVFNTGMNIKVEFNGKEHVLTALSGGESSLVSLMFIFALQFVRPSPFYILDEVDADLDKANSILLGNLIKSLSSERSIEGGNNKDEGNTTQFIVVSHNEHIITTAEKVIGVSKVNGVSQIVGVDLKAKQ